MAENSSITVQNFLCYIDRKISYIYRFIVIHLIIDFGLIRCFGNTMHMPKIHKSYLTIFNPIYTKMNGNKTGVQCIQISQKTRINSPNPTF